jgi:uncharacterized Zn finger protein
LRNNRGRNSWWADQWQALLYEIDPTYLPSHGAGSGRGGSRRSRVQRLDVLPGSLHGQVRDRERGICHVDIEVARLTPKQWQQVIDGLADQAIFAAQLLAGDLPVEVEQVFDEAGVSLLPAAAADLRVTCSECGDAGESSLAPLPPQPWGELSTDSPRIGGRGANQAVCLHVEQVFQQMGEMLADDPWLLFQLRGMERPQILQALRERRLSRQPQESTLPTQPLGPATPESHAFFRLNPEPEGPHWFDHLSDALDGDTDRFWGNAQQLESIQHQVSPPVIELTLLRRLGYPPFSSQSMESYEALAQIYRRVTTQALKVAFGEANGEEAASGEMGDEG